MKKQLAILSILSVTLSFAQVVSVDFENQNEGVYTNDQARNDFVPLRGASSWYAMEQNKGQNAKIVLDDEDHGKVLQLKYPVGCLGPNDDPLACAGQIKQPLTETAEEMWVAYELYFEEGFDFVKGGKLPGLCGGKCYTGGNRPSIGDGWSARVMWRPDGKVVQYLYFVDQAQTYGDDANWDLDGTAEQKYFQIGTWHRLVTKITLNTVTNEGHGEKDGKIKSWFDGELALDLDTLRLRDYADQRIDVFYLSTFHGGSDNTWSPTVDSYIRYDHFVISKDSIPVTSSTTRMISTKQEIANKNFQIAIGNSVLLKTPLKEETCFDFYTLDGQWYKTKTYAKETTRISLPNENKVFIIKTR
ncbi:MAG TPA: alginate lyase [Fibrobacteraceae bacterium]|nr:alginate lyase [Fibrobacteraceae bacterium]